MRIAYRGNFRVPFSTETHVACSFEEVGHTIVRLQEDERSWLETLMEARNADLFLWTSTYSFAHKWPQDDARHALKILHDLGVPSVGFHLDLWWGLRRESQVSTEPFFQVDHLFTADGDNDARWLAAGVNHHWLPPAVYGPECYKGTPKDEFRYDVVFVGNWNGNYHAEWWPYRSQLLNILRRRYGQRFQVFPQTHAIRGQALNDLYASAKVVVGDSCFANRARRYFSDRAFETVGRGGFLLMPYISGLAQMLDPKRHMDYFKDLTELPELVDYYLENQDEREAIRTAGLEEVRTNHTYRHRMQQMIAELQGASLVHA